MAVYAINMETIIPNMPSTHQWFFPKKMLISITADAIESLLWCHPSAFKECDFVFLYAQKEN